MNEAYRISDDLWEQIKPILPPELPRPRGGRPRMDRRKAMEAILYVFRTGCEWKSIPPDLGSPGAVRRRFLEWQDAGLFQRMWQAGLMEYDEMREMVWYGKR
jgi:putative transposase